MFHFSPTYPDDIQIEVDVSSYGKGIFLVEVCYEKGIKCHMEKVLIQ